MDSQSRWLTWLPCQFLKTNQSNSLHRRKANLTKFEFNPTKVIYIGFRLTPLGILPGADKLIAVNNSEPSKNVHELRQFLGLFDFLTSHGQNCAQTGSPLNKLKRDGKVETY
jgi:hypothetical protein